MDSLVTVNPATQRHEDTQFSSPGQQREYVGSFVSVGAHTRRPDLLPRYAYFQACLTTEARINTLILSSYLQLQSGCTKKHLRKNGRQTQEGCGAPGRGVSPQPPRLPGGRRRWRKRAATSGWIPAAEVSYLLERQMNNQLAGYVMH